MRRNNTMLVNLPISSTTSAASFFYRHKYCVMWSAVALAICTNLMYFCCERPAHEAAQIVRSLDCQTQILREEQCLMERVTSALVLNSQPGYGVTLSDLAQSKQLVSEAAAKLQAAEKAYLSARCASNGGLPVDNSKITECYGAIIVYAPVIYGLQARIATIECEAYLTNLVAMVNEEEKLADGLLLAAEYSANGATGATQSPHQLLQMQFPSDWQAKFKKVETVLKDRQPFLNRKQIDLYQSLINGQRQKFEQFHPAPATPPAKLIAFQFPA